ncbi:transglycosylase SLT domain-containing protein [Metabacillus sp. RGM 3146]|uniref:transglycosylase SLT domain-containing protein n=1 Tax=Metabacillus sp. RGM 3146 TaxID=3401092 RepID=UPI003B9B94F5
MKKLLTAVLAASIVFVPASFTAKAGGVYKELSYFEKKSLLTKVALEENIPPEILKAIALNESKMMQFKNGEPNVTKDGGIGIMQVTPDSLNDYEKKKLDLNPIKLVEDTEYNIRKGAAILKMKWDLSGKSLPSVNNHDPRNLEHWYFAVMAYNGFSEKNNPNTHSSTYQNDIYNYIKNNAKQYLNDFPKPALKVDEKGSLKYKFNENWEYANTPSMMMLKPGYQVVTRVESNLRDNVSANAKITKIPVNTLVQITGEAIESPELKNLFSYYPVKILGKSGYMATSNLKALTLPVPFQDKKQSYPYGGVAINENVPIYQKANGSFNPSSKSLLKGTHKDVIGIENGYYKIGSNEYVLHDPKKLQFVTGRLYINADTPTRVLETTENSDANHVLKKNKNFNVNGIDQNYYYWGTKNGRFLVVPKMGKNSYSIGRAQPKKNGVPMYYPNSSKVFKLTQKKELLKIFRVDDEKNIYDLGNGYYVKKSDVNYLTY